MVQQLTPLNYAASVDGIQGVFVNDSPLKPAIIEMRKVFEAELGKEENFKMLQKYFKGFFNNLYTVDGAEPLSFLLNFIKYFKENYYLFLKIEKVVAELPQHSPTRFLWESYKNIFLRHISNLCIIEQEKVLYISTNSPDLQCLYLLDIDRELKVEGENNFFSIFFSDLASEEVYETCKATVKEAQEQNNLKICISVLKKKAAINYYSYCNFCATSSFDELLHIN